MKIDIMRYMDIIFCDIFLDQQYSLVLRNWKVAKAICGEIRILWREKKI